MSIEQNKSLVRRFFDEMITGNVERLDEYVAEDFTTVNAWKNRDGLKKVMKDFRAAFSKLEFSQLDIIAEGDKVVIHYQVTCTNQDSRKIITAVHIDRIADGKIVEGYACGDSLLLEKAGGGSSPPLATPRCKRVRTGRLLAGFTSRIGRFTLLFAG